MVAPLIRWITALCLVGLVGSTQAGAYTIAGRVVDVADGDTITILDAQNRQHKVRLNGIDSPEMGQPFGRASKKHLSDLLAGSQVVADCGKTDRFGREVCLVRVGEVVAGLEQVKAGMAWYFRRYANEMAPARREHLDTAETDARTDGKGLWAESGPVPPWDWRGTRSMQSK